MEMYQCKLCFRKFMSGRALKVHMARSHFKFPLPHKVFQENKESTNVQHVELTQSTLTEVSMKRETIEENEDSYVFRDNPRKGFKVMDTELFDPEFFDVEVFDVELTGGKRKMENDELVKDKCSESRSELSSVSSDEDIAVLLMMLSRGEKQMCEVCNKGFNSSQGLENHRASHKNLGDKKRLKRSGDIKQRNGNKVHECSHCGRIFGSGQALGGHMGSRFRSFRCKLFGSSLDS